MIFHRPVVALCLTKQPIHSPRLECLRLPSPIAPRQQVALFLPLSQVFLKPAFRHQANQTTNSLQLVSTHQRRQILPLPRQVIYLTVLQAALLLKITTSRPHNQIFPTHSLEYSLPNHKTTHSLKITHFQLHPLIHSLISPRNQILPPPKMAPLCQTSCPSLPHKTPTYYPAKQA